MLLRTSDLARTHTLARTPPLRSATHRLLFSCGFGLATRAKTLPSASPRQCGRTKLRQRLQRLLPGRSGKHTQNNNTTHSAETVGFQLAAYECFLSQTSSPTATPACACASQVTADKPAECMRAKITAIRPIAMSASHAWAAPGQLHQKLAYSKRKLWGNFFRGPALCVPIASTCDDEALRRSAKYIITCLMRASQRPRLSPRTCQLTNAGRDVTTTAAAAFARPVGA